MVLLIHLKEEVIATVRELILSDDTLQEYMKLFDQEINVSLDKETCKEATVKIDVSHVNKLPTGNEEGQFLGLDFSGPTIKIMYVKLEYQNSIVTRKMYDIPSKYRSGKYEALFDFIAKCLADFLKGINIKMRRIPLCMTLGFPVEQTSIQDCKILKWSRDFKCNDIFDKNIFLVLKNSFRKFPELKKIYLIGIINESVRVALASEWMDPTCLIGAVIGSGMSCSYVEKVFKITKYDAENYGIRDMYVTVEPGGLGEKGELDSFLTDFDRAFDDDSPNPGERINDKLISIDYFGELARLIILKCLDSDIILGGQMPDNILEKYSINVEHLKRIESDPDDDHTNCREVLKELGFSNVTDEDCFQVQFICRCVSRRSANLVAAQIATLINRINEPSVSVAVEGSLIRSYPNYKWYLAKKIRQLKKEECEFNLKDAEEVGLGEAVLASVFGEEIMNRDEKLRRLPGFPLHSCHFGKNGKCLSPDCNMPRGACHENPLMKAMAAEREDLVLGKCYEEHEEKEEGKKNLAGEKTEDESMKKGKCRECKGYDRL